MARGVFATHLAHQTRKGLPSFQLIFDARGAYYPEFKEYRLVDNDAFIMQVKNLEAAALKNSDAQLAVSHALIDYWREDYEFDASETAAIIPCTLSTGHHNALISAEERASLRSEYGIQPHHALLVYSGSAAGWQSIDELLNWLARLMQEETHLRLLLLTPLESLNGTPLESLADRVLLRWVTPDAVQKFLSMSDYGLLLRSASTTNRVASPTKFAEYLVAGSHVLISPGVGDFSEFAVDHQCGKLVLPDQFPDLQAITENDRRHAHSLAKMHFTKSRYTKAYQQLLSE